jgi:hypothetical protein
MRRIEKARELGMKGRPIHVVISPPEFDWVMNDYEDLRSDAERVAKEAGLKGAALLFHLYRDEATGGELYLSPHFHAVGFGWIDHTDDLYDKTGWVVVNKGIRKSVYRTFQYLLSHAAVWRESVEGGEGILPIAKSKVHTVTWFGSLSYNKLTVEAEDYRDLCPICGQPFVILDWPGIGDPPPEGFCPIELLPEVTNR